MITFNVSIPFVSNNTWSDQVAKKRPVSCILIIFLLFQVRLTAVHPLFQKQVFFFTSDMVEFDKQVFTFSFV